MPDTIYENEDAIENAQASRAMQPKPQVLPGAMPTRMKIPGVNTNGMTNPEIANQLAWEYQPRWYKQYQLKNQYRGMTDLQRRQAIEQTVQRHAAFSGLEGQPPAENMISLHVPTGSTIDQHMGMDYNELSPESRTMYDEGIKRFRKEFSRLMSGSDSTSWKTTADYEKALNNMQSVRDFGHLIESDIFGTARRFVSPEMRVRFDANDRTFDSFKTWADKNNVDMPEAIWADDESPQAREIKKRFYDDPNYEKYRERNGKLELVPPTAEQVTRMRNKANAEDAKASRDIASAHSDETLAKMTPEERDQWFKDEASGKLQKKATMAMSDEMQRAALRKSGLSDADIDAKYDKRTSASGVSYSPKTTDRAALKNELLAEQDVAKGLPVAILADGTPDMKNAEKNRQLVDAKTGQKLPFGGTKQQAEQLVASGVAKWALRDGLKPYVPTAEAQPSQQTTPAAEKTATNPKTGQKLVLRNGQWIPL
jgi:hypothetical protein